MKVRVIQVQGLNEAWVVSYTGRYFNPLCHLNMIYDWGIWKKAEPVYQ